MEAGDVLVRIGTQEGGLSATEAAARLARLGPNRLPQPRRRSIGRIVLAQTITPFVVLLALAAAVTLVLGDYSDAAFILTVIVINTVIGATQEAGADANTAALRRSVPAFSRVIRNGGILRIAAEELVPGDRVLVEAGDRVPADIRLVASNELQADESSLTGESLPEDKAADGALAEDTPLADRLNMVWAGTVLRRGRGEGIVVATGTATQIGHIAKALEQPAASPPLVRRLDAFSRVLGLATIVLVILVVVAQVVAGAPLGATIMVAAALAISVVPEGLPVAVTVALSVATARMARRGVIVRNLPAVEGLGACTVIATDKTGTLTVNRLTAKRVWLPGVGEVAIEDESPAGEEAELALRRLGRSATLVNDASYRSDAPHEATGDTLDIALLVLAAAARVEIDRLRQEAPRIGDLPFSAERRFAASINRHGADHHLHVKGAPEVIVPLCNSDASALLGAAARMAEGGYRVIAVATKGLNGIAPDCFGDELRELTLLGLVGFIDPLRPEAARAVADCKRAGVAVKMVTGDHPATALAIARQLGIAGSSRDVVTGLDLKRAMAGGEEELRRLAQANVFARIEPAQKVEIVEILQRAGHFVAMTGDGVNDAPALRRADIGVAMGRDGTDVARDAADLIITDDNFASIVAGVEEGRAAYANIRKVIFLLLSTGLAEALMFILAMLTGLPLPLTAAQLLWLNLVTNGGQDVALAFEKPGPDLLGKRPRSPQQPLFDRRLVTRTLVSGLYVGLMGYFAFAWAMAQGMTEGEARNIVLFLVVLFENIQAMSARSETRSVFRVPLSDNWMLFLAVAAAQGLQFAAPYIPGLNGVLGVTPIAPWTWCALLAASLTLLVVNEIERVIAVRRAGPD